MVEKHEDEQYFFNAATTAHLADFLSAFELPCCLCAPMVGRKLADNGHVARVLDKDERFADVPGFRRYDIFRPEWLGETYGVILCDPPFFNVSLSQLFAAIRTLSRYDFSQPLLIGYLVRRQDAVLGTFARFGLEPTGYCPSYQTVRNIGRNDVMFYGNLGARRHALLARATE